MQSSEDHPPRPTLPPPRLLFPWKCRAEGCGFVGDPTHAEGRPGQVLRRRHHAKEKAPVEAGEGQEAHEVHGEGQRAAGGLHGRARPQQRMMERCFARDHTPCSKAVPPVFFLLSQRLNIEPARRHLCALGVGGGSSESNVLMSLPIILFLGLEIMSYVRVCIARPVLTAWVCLECGGESCMVVLLCAGVPHGFPTRAGVGIPSGPCA